MPSTLAQRRLRRLWEEGIGLPGDNNKIRGARTGLNSFGRRKDIADVEALIGVVPLDKRFAGKLPPELRAGFMRLVDVVRAGERERRGKPRF